MSTQRILAGLVVLLLLLAQDAVTQDAVTQPEVRQAELRRESLRSQIEASLERFELSTVEPAPVLLQQKIAVQWDNNARDSKVGVTVMFVGRGRPEAVCCVFPYRDELWHEFSSLSRGPLQGKLAGDVFWRTEQAGVDFARLPEASPPHRTAAARASQMKRLARRFQARLLGWRDDDSQRQELRLQARPIYRYEQPAGEVIDGAVFSFVAGVDPEAILLVEALRNPRPHWEYAFARRTSGGLEGRLDDQLVWSAKRYPQMGNPAGINRGLVEPLKREEP